MILKNISICLEGGKSLSIVGVNGVGKTTFVKLICRFYEPTEGEILLNGIPIQTIPYEEYIKLIGVVFQDYRLLPSFTVFENIAYALEVIGMDKTLIRSRVRGVLNLVGLDDKGNAFPKELSGGQQQRVAIARAIANRPKVLIADEPTGNLDPTMSDEIMSVLERINKAYGTTIVMVTHDSGVVNKHRKRTIALEYGHIKADLPGGGYILDDK